MPEPSSRQPDLPAEPATPLPLVTRWALLVLALLSLALGVIGIFVPVLPTVPFVLLSAWAAARSSPRLLAWLESHASFGPMLVEWRRGGVVRRRAKWTATVLMSASAAFMLVVVPNRWVALLAIGCMAGVLAWLWRRPEHLNEDASPPET
ncbi:MAG: YbaN family protein [Polaromonas sp.]|uniref:YbaN family protein n=1 Tax=Polaromonas sp. TaxID=1869339 RepID=UPI002489C88B|nr:YbaN family protein [Polaromonas sp.]MDI1239380.1 YbaN family protein [Polaromonas sp.]MDI1342433.1 YbaN family protein [Polaromonas sp.]